MHPLPPAQQQIDHPPSKPTNTKRHLLHIRVDAAQLGRPAVGQVVHGGLGDVEAGAGAVDGEDVDGAAVVRGAPARAAVGRVPARDGLGAADVREAPDVALDFPVWGLGGCV